MKVTSFFKYHLQAKNEHSIHAPFLFNLYVFLKSKIAIDFASIELKRNHLLKNETSIELDEIGKGSKVLKNKFRTVASIAKTSLSKPKYNELHVKLVQYFKPKIIFELGTSFGINTLYLAKANPNAQIYTFEGSKKIVAIAKQTFQESKNVTLIEGDFDVTLSKTLANLPKNVDYIFLDGNHSHIPTIRYFEQILEYSSENTVFVFDDIHWSNEMEDAWEEIKNHITVTLSVDLLYLGIVFISKKLSKQHFVLKY